MTVTLDPSLARARRRVGVLRSRLTADDGSKVRLVETHISWVLLAGSMAYKLKKPIRLPFLDFRTLKARRYFCKEELRLNRRLAPSLYLDVCEVHEDADGPHIDETGRVVDVCLRMHRFPDDALWSNMLSEGTLMPHHVDDMARRLCHFHRTAAVAPPQSDFGLAAANERVMHVIVEAVDAWVANMRPIDVDWPTLRAWLHRELRTLLPVWEARRTEGRVRECHGDLHLANVLQLNDEATAFDGIEFNAELRWIDVLSDMAFLAMDLLAHGRRDLAFRFLNAYLEASGDYGGLQTLRFYMVYRALVRGVVAAIKQAEREVHLNRDPDMFGYLSLAIALSNDADPRLAITHGLPGSGKTFTSQALLETVGAIRIRSDIERKRLFGLSALDASVDRIPGGIYDSAATANTYTRLRALSQVALQAGWPVIVDAAFLRRDERAEFAALADSIHVPFSILDCQAPEPVLRERIERRQASGGDASEADVAVLERLLNADEPLDERECDIAIAVGDLSATALAQQWLGRGTRV